jgi:hypothetical protein
MRIIITLSLLIIFISCLFIFFISDSLVRAKTACNQGVTSECDDLTMKIVVGVLIAGSFLFVDVLVVYLMIKTWIPGVFILPLEAF